MFKKIELGIKWLRSKFYSLKYQVRSKCQFENVRLWHSPKGTIRIGNQVNILRRTELRALKEQPIIIGNNTFINFDCIIRPNVTIGSNVSVGPGVHFISDNHKMGPSERRAGDASFDAIQVEDGCWIGANVTIISNVKIGKGSVIAAGAVVTRDCEPNSLYAGVPAKLVKKLN
ncbi:acyltransferase [Clostridium paridis]|uniref:Acyltransferase n=1 Tax=Clostridium paridis TaxID=2803863 RepID=A0A937K3P3_9CLOT|nr:DapH/DapD/GlmU-related protein [Clostridium paridis]MBL4932591.1 hypothetical protein [Clostridium paridis]